MQGLDYPRIQREIEEEYDLKKLATLRQEVLTKEAMAAGGERTLTKKEKESINTRAKADTGGPLRMIKYSPYLKQQVEEFNGPMELNCTQGLRCLFHLFTSDNHVTENNYIAVLNLVIEKKDFLFPPDYIESTDSVTQYYTDTIKKYFDVKKKWPAPGGIPWLTWTNQLIAPQAVDAARQRGKKRQREILSKPTVIREDQILLLGRWLKNGVLDQTLDEFNTPKNTLLPGIQLITTTGRGRQVLSRHACKLLMLLQLSIGSRWKGVVVSNQIKKLDVEIPGVDQDMEAGLTSDQRTAYRTYLSLETGYRKDLMIVSGLSKERSKRSNLERLARDPDYLAPEQKSIVKPTLYMFLTQDQFLELLREVRMAFWEIYVNATGGDEDDVPNKEEANTFTVPTDQLQNDETIIRIVNEGNELAVTLLTEAKVELQLPVGNNKGTHMLRKIYAMYSYYLYASHVAKDVAYVRTVLGHKNMTTSLSYTDLIIERPVTANAPFTLEEAMITKLGDLIAEVKDLRRIIDDTGFKIVPLPLQRFSDDEKRAGRHIDRVIDAMSEWPPTVPLTQSNMKKLGIGNNLMHVVRNSNKFQTLLENRRGAGGENQIQI